MAWHNEQPGRRGGKNRPPDRPTQLAVIGLLLVAAFAAIHHYREMRARQEIPTRVVDSKEGSSMAGAAFADPSSSVRTRREQIFPAIETELGISAEQADAVAESFFQNVSRIPDVTTPEDRARGVHRILITSEDQQRRRAELAAILGDKYPLFEPYLAKARQLKRIAQLQQSLANHRLPLLDERQSQALVAVMSTEQEVLDREERAIYASHASAPSWPPESMDDEITRMLERSHGRLLTQSRDLLHRSQLRELRAMLASDLDTRRRVLSQGY